MKRALLILVALAAPAAAQQWSPEDGWNNEGQRQIDQAHREFQKRADEMHRKFEEDSKRMDEDFKRDSWHMFLPFGAFFVAILVISGVSAAQRRRRGIYTPAIEAINEPIQIALLPSGNIDVTVLRIGLDGRAGKLVAGELDRITKQFETTSGEGRSSVLREMGVVLRRVRASWLYGGAVNEPMRSLAEAKAVFAKHVDDARVQGDATGSVDAGGIVVVTIVVAARGELMSVDHIGAEEIRRALEAASYRDPNELVAVGIVATRAADANELASQYPQPQLQPLAAPGGAKAYCAYCGTPFPTELVSCPQCGGPARREVA
ncbi:MAG TPA: DUF1517 domain-containing protein [Kofleriaceae bacterium]|nr:DUF1517 domain-containing protein [Kofleriaceae bacterium]